MTFAVYISRDDLPETLVEAAEADGENPSEVFREHMDAVSQWAEGVENGDESGAVVHAIEEVYRTVDGVTADSALDDAETTERGKFDMRKHTKIED